jgi:selenide, water dikinase
VPGGTLRNVEQASRFLCGYTPSERVLQKLCDAQTSGGLLFTCDPAAAGTALDRLRSSGHEAAVVGEVRDGASGSIEIAAL